MHRLSIILLLFLSALLPAQELPPVVSYEADAYGAGTQNWMITQDDDLFIYAANNQGLLEFNGQQWTLHPSPNETIIRSVQAHDGRIYTGSYMDFGFWERTPEGSLQYASLADSLTGKVLPDEQFWNIFQYEEYIVFQSLWQLFLYRPGLGVASVLTPPGGITRSFPTPRGLFFTNGDDRLFRLDGGLLTEVGPESGLRMPIVHLWTEGDDMMIQSASTGTYRLRDERLEKADRHPFLAGKQIYSATSLRSGGLAFGTISDGVYIVSPGGKLRYHLTQVDGLTNNTILSLYEDRRNNLWAGTDNGISHLNLSSPFRKYTDVTGRLGTIHTSAVHEGRLYLGSNQGLFVRDLRSEAAFELVPGTRGQVWSLFEHDGQLWGGHDIGAFIVGEKGVEFMFKASGVWTFLAPLNHPERLLAGTYDGVWVFEKNASGWKAGQRISGFDYSARFLAMRDDRELYISHEYRGIFGLQLDREFSKVTELKVYDAPSKGKNAGLTTFENDIYYASRKGFFRLRDFATGFQPDTMLNGTVDTSHYTSGKMAVVDDRLWFFTSKDVSFFHKGSLSDGLQRQTVPVPADQLRAKSGYENINAVGSDTFLIGTGDGYLLLALASVPLHQHKVYLTSAEATTGTGVVSRLSIAGNEQLAYTAHNLSFRVSVPAYNKYFTSYFQYRLVGMTDAWSAWSTQAEINFPDLPYGNYVLEVRSLLGRRTSEQTMRYPFTIKRPWYATYPMLALYAFGAGLLIYLLHRAYTRHYRRKQVLWREENERRITAERREAELALTRVTNERLEVDIATKNREMASSTMNLVKKNELLQQIKADLLAGDDPRVNIRRVVKTIDHNIDEAETWNLFRDAFENADQDFFRKVKDRHPELTPNDLKLCAYLRLNLSSKEIAPMLNISVRSVEVKRYRLRKKMGLEREAGLVEYVLGL